MNLLLNLNPQIQIRLSQKILTHIMKANSILASLTKSFLLALILSTITCSKESSIHKEQTIQHYSFNKEELDLMELINKHRNSIGLERLLINEHLAYVAAQHNTYMIETKSINHNGFPNRMEELNQLLGASSVAENIAYNYNTPQQALTAWLRSSSHKKNIEGNYTQFGLSIKVDTTSQKKYYTNLFIKKLNQ